MPSIKSQRKAARKALRPPEKPASLPSITDIVARVLDPKRKNVEPVMRLRRGEGIGYVSHRFPVKGGISYADLMARNVMRNNALFSKLKERSGA